jgi:heptosyltransferase-2
MNNFKRILIIRTDRIGDVLLSTSVFKVLRKYFPYSHIAVMVRPYARDIVLGNPYIDELVIYDKYGTQRSLLQSIKFAWHLKRKNFDLALVLHPTNRAHLITFFSGIKRRVGFKRKLAFLLTDAIEHKKQSGQKHEMEYTLDIIRALGIKPSDKDKDLFMPIRKDSEMFIEQFLKDHRVNSSDKMIAVHPTASCLSKTWPLERFAQVVDSLVREFNVKVLVVSGADDVGRGRRLVDLLHCASIDVTGKTTVSQLASLLRRCSLFISNDSGPVHIARALDVPVVVIFGRAQPGLSPQRWGPIGEEAIVLHKDVGCTDCLAHNCPKGFACLLAISSQEVLDASKKLLGTVPHN